MWWKTEVYMEYVTCGCKVPILSLTLYKTFWKTQGNSGNLEYTQGILVFEMSFFRDTICNTQQADM